MSDAPHATLEPVGAVERSPASRRGVWIRAFCWLATLLVVAMAIWQGLALRQWAWNVTDAIHYSADIERGYGWGLAGSGADGYLNLYDKMAAEEPGWHPFLDYAPLRLLVMTLWAGHNRRTQTPFDEWRPDYAFNRPVLWFNAGMELVGVVAAFFLVRRVVVRARAGPPALSWPREWAWRLRGRALPAGEAPPVRRPFDGWAAGLLAATLLWFNPAMILSAHGWPTWDSWIVPMYLLALLAAVYDRWFLAGLAMAVGVMFKGQQFVGVPVFLAWTLLNGRWRAAVHFLGGGVIGVAAIASPWLVTRLPIDVLVDWFARFPNGPPSFAEPPLAVARQWNWPAMLWPLGVVAAGWAASSVGRLPRWWRVSGIVLCAAAIGWPMMVRADRVAAALVIAVATLAATSALMHRRSTRLVLLGSSAATALLGGIVFFHASAAWWTCGIAYGASHHRSLIVGLTDNLPGLLARRFGWEYDAPVFVLPTWLGGATVVMGVFLRGVFVAFLVPCLWAVARQARRNDPRLLLAVATPWLVFFCLPPQIHERYLLYGAAVASLAVGQSAGMTLLGLFLTVMAFVQPFQVMLTARGFGQRTAFGEALHHAMPWIFDSTAGFTLLRVLNNTFPDAAWAVLLASGILVYQSLRSSPKMAGFSPTNEMRGGMVDGETPPDIGRPVPSRGTPGEG